MKTRLTEPKFKSAIGVAGWLVSRIACLGAVILICASASAQNLFVSEYNPDDRNCNEVGYCGNIVKFTWDGTRSVFASNLIRPEDLAFDSASNLYVVALWHAGIWGGIVIDKIAPDGTRTGFASGSSLPLHLAGDNAGNLFVVEYSSGIIYKYKPDGSRTTFASGLYHPVGITFDSAGNLFVVDNSAGVTLGSIYEYHPDGSRVTFAVLAATDRPAALAFDSMGNLLMGDLGGNIYKYKVGGIRLNSRTIFGSVPNGAQSMACDSAGNLFVVNAGNDNMLYKFTMLGVRSSFNPRSCWCTETLACIAAEPTLH